LYLVWIVRPKHVMLFEENLVVPEFTQWLIANFEGLEYIQRNCNKRKTSDADKGQQLFFSK